MAIAFLISSRSEVDPFTLMAVDLAVRLDQPLAILCPAVEADQLSKKKNNNRTAKSRDESNQPTDEPEQPPARFINRADLVPVVEERVRSQTEGGDMPSIQVEVFEVPADPYEIRGWLSQPPETERFGRFEIESLFIPLTRGSGGESKHAKNKLFELVACEAIYLCVNAGQESRLPLTHIGYSGATTRDRRIARRVAQRFSFRRPVEVNLKNRDPELTSVVVGIPGKAAQTRIDNVKVWNELRRDRELPVAMIVNPADSLIDRMLWAIDDRLRIVFSEYQMKRSDRERLAKEMTDGTRHSPEFVLFMGIATLLASIGLLQDSPAVVIGAMLVAPLMTPLLGAGLAMIQGNRPLFIAALNTILVGLSISFAIGVLVGLVSMAVPVGLFPDSQLRLTSQMVARSHPNLMDPLIGLAGGLAGGFAIGRDKKIGALAGVAIAAALVPPIATAGLETVIVLAGAVRVGSISVIVELLSGDPSNWLRRVNMIVENPGSTSNVQLVFAPLALFLMNACAVILGAFIGMRLVGMHRTTYPRESKRWVTAAGVMLLLAVIVLLMAIPVVAFYS